MRLIITIKMDNAAFDDDDGVYEVARILAEYADMTRAFGSLPMSPLRDINGNTVGSASVQP